MLEAKIRLCVDHPLAEGQSVPLTEAQAHYLFGVMRCAPGQTLRIFNGHDGEWLAKVEAAGKRGGTLHCAELLRPQDSPADLWLVFAPVKKARTDMIVEKAVELGAARLVPVQTDFTNAERLRDDKARAHVREAAEQCETTVLPEVAPLQPLARLLAAWPAGRALIWADEGAAREAGGGGRGPDLPGRLPPAPAAILIGPEGGFSGDERARLAALPFVHPVTLGPRILRAETAAIALLALWQATRGDW